MQDDWPPWGRCFQHGVSNSHRIPRSVWEEVVLKEQSNIAPSLSSGFLPGQVSPLLWCWGLTRGEQSPVLLRDIQDYVLNKSIFFTKFSASRISLQQQKNTQIDSSLRHPEISDSRPCLYSWHIHRVITWHLRVENNLSTLGHNFNTNTKELGWKQHLVFDLEPDSWALNSGPTSSVSSVCLLGET